MRMPFTTNTDEHPSPLAMTGIELEGDYEAGGGRFLRILFEKCAISGSTSQDEYFLIASVLPVRTFCLSVSLSLCLPPYLPVSLPPSLSLKHTLSLLHTLVGCHIHAHTRTHTHAHTHT